MNKWDQRYQSDAYLYGTQPNDFLRERVNHIPKGRVLSLAEGEGRNAVYLALQGHEVTAVDASSVGLEKARQLAGKHRVKVNWIQSNLGDFDLGTAQWDAIVSIFCHIAPDQRRALHQGVVTGLKPGGLFLLEAYTPEQLNRDTGGPPTQDLMMSRDLLQRELPGLEFKYLKETVRDIQEGSYHTGPGAVVQALAIKPQTVPSPKESK